MPGDLKACTELAFLLQNLGRTRLPKGRRLLWSEQIDRRAWERRELQKRRGGCWLLDWFSAEGSRAFQ